MVLSVTLTLCNLDVFMGVIDEILLRAHLCHLLLGNRVLKLVGLVDVVSQVFLQLRCLVFLDLYLLIVLLSLCLQGTV